MPRPEHDLAVAEAEALAKAYKVADPAGLERLARDLVSESIAGDVTEAFNRLVAAQLRVMALRARNGGW
ncbi:MAG: hypothetical protein ABIO39_02450 [Caulobacteraceae bacterium]